MVQVIEEATGEILYTVRAASNRFWAPVYASGNYTLKVGKQKPDMESFTGLTPASQHEQKTRILKVEL